MLYEPNKNKINIGKNLQIILLHGLKTESSQTRLKFWVLVKLLETKNIIQIWLFDNKEGPFQSKKFVKHLGINLRGVYDKENQKIWLEILLSKDLFINRSCNRRLTENIS